MLSLLLMQTAGCARNVPEPQASLGVTPTVDMNDLVIAGGNLSQEEAIVIAGAEIPQGIMLKGTFSGNRIDSTWIVRCSFIHNSVNGEELGWTQGEETRFLNAGILPQNIFRYLTFEIDAETGKVLTRTASDSLVIEAVTGSTVNPSCGCE
ncbi:hypothetical protein DGWBC_1632 [Dehalogenimonas sp. WBC-2]|nr:hypothetical protein DGWBC_1632 [Dehalogenimonas sp. WBC-2]